jgi:predicted HTH transcriptional regulator
VEFHARPSPAALSTNLSSGIIPTADILERYLMLATKSRDELVPTVAGLLLFGRDDSIARFLPRATVVATRFGGENAQAPVIERLELQGNLATLTSPACDL